MAAGDITLYSALLSEINSVVVSLGVVKFVSCELLCGTNVFIVLVCACVRWSS